MKQTIKIGILIILLDAVVNALPVACAMYQGDLYLPDYEKGPLKNFIKSLGFHSVMYILLVCPVHLVLIGMYTLIARETKPGLVVSVLMGLFLALSVYLWYAYSYSFDWSFTYFPYKIIWYSVLGSVFGWLYYTKVSVLI